MEYKHRENNYVYDSSARELNIDGIILKNIHIKTSLNNDWELITDRKLYQSKKMKDAYHVKVKYIYDFRTVFEERNPTEEIIINIPSSIYSSFVYLMRRLGIRDKKGLYEYTFTDDDFYKINSIGKVKSKFIKECLLELGCKWDSKCIN